MSLRSSGLLEENALIFYLNGEYFPGGKSFETPFRVKHPERIALPSRLQDTPVRSCRSDKPIRLFFSLG